MSRCIPDDLEFQYLVGVTPTISSMIDVPWRSSCNEAAAQYMWLSTMHVIIIYNQPEIDGSGLLLIQMDIDSKGKEERKFRKNTTEEKELTKKTNASKEGRHETSYSNQCTSTDISIAGSYQIVLIDFGKATKCEKGK